MSDIKHTPGPWEFTTRPDSGGASRPVVTRGFDLICAVSRQNGGMGSESEANARLIAAAPELLEEHQKSLGIFERLDEQLSRMGYRQTNDLRKMVSDSIRATKAVIAKAEGKP